MAEKRVMPGSKVDRRPARPIAPVRQMTTAERHDQHNRVMAAELARVNKGYKDGTVEYFSR